MKTFPPSEEGGKLCSIKIKKAALNDKPKKLEESRMPVLMMLEKYGHTVSINMSICYCTAYMRPTVLSGFTSRRQLLLK